MRTARVLAAVLVLAALSPLPRAAAAAQPRTSLTTVQDDLMCVACHQPLAVSQSPQANSERQLIRHLIALGNTKAQIEHVMVAQYGPSVLARPPARGFNLTVYILPPAAVLLGVAIVVFAVRRWRRNSRRTGAKQVPAGPLTNADARRLEEDLARYKG